MKDFEVEGTNLLMMLFLRIQTYMINKHLKLSGGKLCIKFVEQLFQQQG